MAEKATRIAMEGEIRAAVIALGYPAAGLTADNRRKAAAVQENQLREARKVWNRLVIRGKVAGAGEPANVRPDKAALCRRMLVLLLIRMLVMMPMRRCPPKRTSLHRSVSQNCE